MSDELNRILDLQRAALASDGVASYEERVDRLDRCIALLVDHQQEICDAVNADFGCRSHHVTKMSDLFTSINALKFVKKNLRKWIRPEKRRAAFPMGLLGARAVIHYQPKGVVGIMSPWNVPVNMVFGPLADVIGAGNRAMIKPSEFNPETVALLQTLFQKYFDESEIAIISGDADVGAAFSALPLDHIIFTGSGRIGKMVLQSAAANLTPVTLELGGKSPVIVSQSADIKDAAEKIMTTKAMNAGQLCVSPDYCFVPRDSVDEFVDACRNTIQEQYPTYIDNPDYVAIINQRNFERVASNLDDARSRGARVESLSADGEADRDAATRKIPIHLVIEPTDEMTVMQEELFGPVLCVRAYDAVDQCIDDINARPRPLALYYLGSDRSEQQSVINGTTAGGMCVNDLAVHVACDDLPFGGIGASGMGYYHGHEGFKTFSHAKSVFRQGPFNLPKLSGMLPPYGETVDKMMARMLKR